MLALTSSKITLTLSRHQIHTNENITGVRRSFPKPFSYPVVLNEPLKLHTCNLLVLIATDTM